MVRADLERLLAGLEDLGSPALRAAWREISSSLPPRVSPKMLRLALAWEIQSRLHGGLPRRLSQRLDQLAGAKTATRDTRPGMRLVRAWNGTVHTVTINEEGAAEWNGKTWRSLSEVAREITGTRWSGPAFFGLKHKAAPARRAAA